MTPLTLNDLDALVRDAAAIRFAPVSSAETRQAETIAREAIGRAITLRRLERASQATGFQALPLPLHLTRLAREVGVEHLLPRFPSVPAELGPWVRLAREIRTDATYLALWIRGWFATFEDDRPALARVAARDTFSDANHASFVEVDSPEDFAAALVEIESTYPETRKRQLETWLNVWLKD